MAYNNWQQPNSHSKPYVQNTGYGIPPPYTNPAINAPPAPYQNPAYHHSQQWRPQTTPPRQSIPSAPYQYAALPPAPPPQSQQVPSYMNYNPGSYGNIAGNSSSPAQHPPPALQNRTQQGTPAQQAWPQTQNLAPAPFRPSVTGSVRYNFRPDPSRWHGDAAQTSQSSNRPPSRGYDSGPWPVYSESPKTSPMQQNATLAGNSVSPPYSPGPGRAPTLPPRPVNSASPSPPAFQRQAQRGSPGAGQHTAGQPSNRPGNWFNPSGSVFPQFPATEPTPPFSTDHNTQYQPPPPPPPMPPRPAHGSVSSAGRNTPTPSSKGQAGPVSPIEHRDSLNSLYDPPPSRPTTFHHQSSEGVAGASFRPSLPADRKPTSADPATPDAVKSSVFSLGASSDWEHFDNGGAEDVDDTALYTRKQDQQQPQFHTVELDSTEIRPSKPQEVHQVTGQVSKPPQAHEEQSNPAITASTQPVEAADVAPKEIQESQAEPTSRSEKSNGGDMRTSLDSHLQKLTMEESHVKNVDTKPHTHQSSQSVDIAPALDVWYKNSLLRYIAMLYREAGADTVEEKHKVFTDFFSEESKLRGLDVPTGTSNLQVPNQQWSEVFSPSDVVVTGAEQTKDQSSNDRNEATPVAHSRTSSDDDIQYSPGGRPLIGRPTSSGRDTQPEASSSSKPPADSSVQEQAGPNRVIESLTKLPETETTKDSTVPVQAVPPPPLSTKPTYTPFRDRDSNAATVQSPVPASAAPATTAGSQDAAARDKQGAYKPYVPFAAGILAQSESAQSSKRQDTAPTTPIPLTAASISQTTPNTSPSPSKLPQAGLPSPSVVQQPQTTQVPQMPARKGSDAAQASPPAFEAPSMPVRTPTLSSLKRQPTLVSPAVQKLDQLVFETNQEPALNPRLENLKTSLLLYPSDYNFVNTAFDKWKTTAAGNRARAEAEARTRYNDSQQNIDELFNDNQIAYHDIALLEDTFKKQEAEVRREENEAEYDSYLAEVFEPLYKRLREEIGAVTELLLEAQTMVKEDGVAGKMLLNLQESDKIDLAEGLGLVVDLHHKLEERHDELAECIVKRDRRRQAIDELATDGVDKLTQIEFRKRLDSIERQASVTRCEEKKARVQPLWQLCRASAMRGTRENKQSMNDILLAVEAAGNDLVGADQTLLKVRTLHTLEELAKRCRSLEDSFYGLDTELNLVEYNAAMAHATLDKAPRSVAVKLTEEKDAEDLRLKSEHEDRLRGVQTALQNGQDSIEKVSRGLLGSTDRALKAQAELEKVKRQTGDFRSALSVMSPS